MVSFRSQTDSNVCYPGFLTGGLHHFSISNMYSQFESSSSASFSWDVFLSGGADSRKSFTDHLYSALVRKGINTFRDDDLLERGDEVSEALLRAIDESKISLIVFSPNYASSRWCLDELLHILECKHSKREMVLLPIFYKVEPSDVRHQRGAIGEAFAEHERRFKDDKYKVSRWRAALSEAANFSRYEYEFIEKDSAHVKEPIFLEMPKYQVGLESRVEQMLDMLDIGGGDVRMVGIWGCGGIGKTTIAKAVYNTIAHKFDGCCFLANVREGSKQHGGLVNLQGTILSNILWVRELKVHDVDEGIQMLRTRLVFKRILLVVDDVDTLDQLKKLAGRTDWFGYGSRIVITTRDKRLLTAHAVNSIYKAKELDHHEGFELFSSITFLNKRILNDDDKFLIRTAVRYTGGLPLALVVLGSLLCSRPVHQWQDLLDGYKRNLPEDIREVLKVSFDGLNDIQKEVFLGIACFFKGTNTSDVIQTLECCGHINAKKSIEILEEKALIYVDEYGRICMHDLLEEMGYDIVRRESIEPGERSRLWHLKDMVPVLTDNTGTSKIEGTVVKRTTANETFLSPEVFGKIESLKILMSYAGFFGKSMINQTHLSLGGCQFLEKIPNLSGSQNLELLDLSGCVRLQEVHPSVGSLQNLKSLWLSECQLLEQIPDLSGSQNLELLDLSGCVRLKEVHPSVGSLQNLKSLWLSECQLLEQIPDLSGSQNLELLYLSGCVRLKEVHPSVGSLQNLKYLRLRECQLPEDISDLSGIQNFGLLDLSGCIEVLPSIRSLQIWRYLKFLSFESCEFIKLIPDISGLPMLKNLNINDCISLVGLDDSVGELDNLVDLSLSGCHNLITFPRRISLKSVKHISFKDCQMLKSFPEIVPGMENFTLLDLSGTAIRQLPSSISYLSSLEELVLKECEQLTNIPRNIYELQHLWRLDLQNCSKLVEFPDWRSESLQIETKTSHNLWHLNLCGCKMLEEIPELPPTVEWINVADCLQLKRFAKLSNILVDEEPEMIKCITMFNCQRLCDSLALEIAKKGNLLRNGGSLCSLFISCKQSEFNIVFPGSEVPQWFSDRKDLMELRGEFETSFKIPSNFNLVNKGFAICAAAATVENFKPEGAEIMQQSYFTATIGINANKIVTRSFYFEAEDIDSAHIWLCYVPFVKFVSYHVPDFTCKISLEHCSHSSMRIKSFGCHLVFPQDEDEDEGEDGDGDGEVDEEEEDEDEDEDSGCKN